MGTTANGYPYPEDTDLLAQGAQAIKALANAVDPKAAVSAAGVATVTVTNVASATIAVTFPAGRFTAAPAVVASCEHGNYFAVTYGRTPTGFTLMAHNNTNAVGTFSVPTSWVARLVG